MTANTVEVGGSVTCQYPISSLEPNALTDLVGLTYQAQNGAKVSTQK